MNPIITFRFAKREDCPLILDFIKGIAKYEKLSHQVEATVATLEEWIFDKKSAEVIFAVLDDGVSKDKEVGFAVFCQNFSTFVGRAGMYLEDIYVLPEYRNRGIGKAFLKELTEIAKTRGYGRMEWSCLDWNTPAIELYLKLGAEQMSEWTTYRLKL
jgi:GNAT superfamily N-acetyltransferase